VTEGCNIYGSLDHCVVSDGVTIGRGARIKDSIIFPNAYIGEDAIIEKTIIGEGAIIGKGVKCGMNYSDNNPYASILTDDLVLIKGNIKIEDGTELYKGSMVRKLKGLEVEKHA